MSKKERARGRLQRLLLMHYTKNELDALKLVKEMDKNYALLVSLVGHEIETAMKASHLTDRITKAEALRINKDWQNVLNSHPELKDFTEKQLATHLMTVDQALKYSLDTHLTANSMANQKLLKEALETAYQKSFLEVAYQLQQAAGVYALKYSLDTHLTANSMANQKLLKEALETAYQKSFLEVAYQLQQAAGVYQQVHNPHHIAQLITKSWVGHENFISRFTNDKEKTLKELEVIFRQGYLNNTPPQQLAVQYAKRVGVSQSNAKRLVMTEMANVFGQATADAYEANGVEEYEILATLDNRTSDICQNLDGQRFKVSEKRVGVNYEANGVEEYEILATLDNRTSDICQNLDGQRFKVSEKRVGVNYPPFHPLCRTTTIPVINRFANSNSKRWSKDEDGIRHQVDNMTYTEWADRYFKN